MFWRDNYLNRAMRGCLRQSCQAFDISRDVVGDLLVLSLIQVANMKYESFLEAHGIEEQESVGDQPSDDEKLSRWRSFRAPDKDVPFACIRNGAFENLRFIVRHGIPEF